MRRKPKVYLDTSIISALFDERNPGRRSLTKAFFGVAIEFQLFISKITRVEIERTPDLTQRNTMTAMLSQFVELPLTDDVEWLAKEYLRYGAVPESYSEDASHIAAAVVNEMDFLLSWNFRHIVRRQTKDVVKMVNSSNGFRQIEIMTPAELL